MAGGGRSVKSRDRQCLRLTLAPFPAWITVSELVHREICWRVRGGVAAAAVLVWRGTAVKPGRRDPITNLIAVLGCSVFSFFHPWHFYNSTKLKFLLIGVVCVVGQGALNPVEFEKQKANK